MGNVHFTMATTQLKLYTSQPLPYNGNCTLHHGYHTFGIVHFTMITHNGNCTIYNDYHTMGTVHFPMVKHNKNSTLNNRYHKMVTVHFTVVTTQWKLYTSQWFPHNGKCTVYNGYGQWQMALHDGYHTIGTLHFTMVTNKGNCTLHNG